MLIGDTQTIPAAIAQVYFATRLYISKYHEYDNLGHLLNVANDYSVKRSYVLPGMTVRCECVFSHSMSSRTLPGLASC